MQAHHCLAWKIRFCPEPPCWCSFCFCIGQVQEACFRVSGRQGLQVPSDAEALPNIRVQTCAAIELKVGAARCGQLRKAYKDLWDASFTENRSLIMLDPLMQGHSP